MKKIELTERELLLIEKLSYYDEDELEIYLGKILWVGITQQDLSKTGSFYGDLEYHELGKEFWDAVRYELFDQLCNKEKKEPKEWVNDLVVGDIRNLIIGIVSAISSTFSVSLGIAVPVAALILKRNILSFCKHEPKRNFQENTKYLKVDDKQQNVNFYLDKYKNRHSEYEAFISRDVKELSEKNEPKFQNSELLVYPKAVENTIYFTEKIKLDDFYMIYNHKRELLQQGKIFSDKLELKHIGPLWIEFKSGVGTIFIINK